MWILINEPCGCAISAVDSGSATWVIGEAINEALDHAGAVTCVRGETASAIRCAEHQQEQPHA